MATLSLSIPKAFGKTILAEEIQKFVIQAMKQAWDEGYKAGKLDGYFETSEEQNPYTAEQED